MKKLKKLAKEAYNSKEVCQEWKDKILEAYPEVKPELEGWYKTTAINNKWLSYFDGERYLYGFNGAGDWEVYKKRSAFSQLQLTDLPATEKEVSEALIKEAKKRGYKEGVIFIDLLYNTKDDFQDECFEIKGDYLENKYGDRIFCLKTGKWAEIIEQEPEEIKVTYEEVKPKVIELDGVKYRLTEIKNK